MERRAGLVVTHHPVLFRPGKRLTTDDAQAAMLLDLIAARIAVYSPHTAYDSAADGINEQLARRLGLTSIEPLRPLPGPARCKIVCFVPRANLAAVQEALWTGGAGVIGEYSKCSFVLDGMGSFEGSAASNPTVGEAERFETVAASRVEVVCPERLVPEALRRLGAAHPYEEPAYDIYPLKPDNPRRGSGRIGLLPAPHPLADFVALVKAKLMISEVPFTGDGRQPISRVAIACGSGGEFLSAAIGKKCDVLLTGEARFHTSLEARAAGIGLVLAGHYATERPAM